MDYTVKKGDNAISILRKFGLNSVDQLIDDNSHIRDINNLREGDILHLPVEITSSIKPTTVTAKMPNYDNTPYYQLPASVKPIVDGWAQAIRDHKKTVNDVPALYRQQAYNQSIRQATNEAAPEVLDKVLLAPVSYPDKLFRAGLNEALKPFRSEGTRSYDFSDFMGSDASFMSKDFQETHPVADAVINTVATPAAAFGASKISSLEGAGQRMMANGRGVAKAMGLEETAIPRNVGVELPGRSSGAVYQTGTKGVGKTGTVRGGRSSGYSSNTSAKGTYTHSSSYTPKGNVTHVTPNAIVVPEAPAGTIPIWGFNTALPAQEEVRYVFKQPAPVHIEHTEPVANPMIYNTTSTGTAVPYTKGMEGALHYLTLAAKRGNSVEEQPVIEESIQKHTGVAPRSAREVPGAAPEGTPSKTLYSGFGYVNGNPLIKK